MPRASRRQRREERHRRAQQGYQFAQIDPLLKRLGVLVLLSAVMICGGIYFSNPDLDPNPTSDPHFLDTSDPTLFSDIIGRRPTSEVPGTFFTNQEPDPDNSEDQPKEASLEEMLASTRDKTHRLPLAPYYALLRKAHSLSEDQLKQAAASDIGYAHLVPEPKKYRGKLIALKGIARRITEFEAPKNRDGFDKLYEAWIFTSESAQNPYVVIFSELPEGAPLGDELQEDVEFEGFFYKLWAYQAQDTARFAPLLLGRRLTWHPDPEDDPPPPITGVFVVSLSAAVLMLVVIVAGLKFSRTRSKPVTPDNLSNEDLADYAGPSIDEFLEDFETHGESPENEQA